MQDVDLAGLGVDARRADRELPFVGADGEVAYGHRAVAGALLTGNRALALAGRLLASSLLDRPLAAVYGWVAGNRGSLPGGTASCALPTPPGATVGLSSSLVDGPPVPVDERLARRADPSA